MVAEAVGRVSAGETDETTGLNETKGPRKLRTPTDIRREQGPSQSGAPRGDRLTWPEGFVRGAADRDALAVLLGLATLTPRRLLQVAAGQPTASACLAAAARGRGCSQADRLRAANADPAAVAVRIRDLGARLLAVGDPEYPASLLELFDPPAGLFEMGRPLAGEGRDRVAIVGARNASASGKEVARSLARSLAAAGVGVVSGGARGIDAAAHEGALDGGGRTVAVLGCGLDVAYPPQNRKLFESLAVRGTLVSEYPPGTPPEPFRFPARNRIVAGLCRAVVVVEGTDGSGSLITADHALETGREVFAVPGAVQSELSQASLSLIREGAGLIRGPDDLLADLGLHIRAGRGTDAPAGSDGSDGSEADWETGLPPPDRAVFAALGAAAAPDELASRLGSGLPEVLSALMSLELRGLVRRVGGRYERRTPEGEGP